MAIKTHTCKSITCDVCEYEYDEDDGIRHFDTPAKALEEARESGWWATDTDILCTDRDDEHLTKARELAAAFAALYPIDGEGWDAFLAWCPEAWRRQLQELRPLPPFAAVMPGQTELAVALTPPAADGQTSDQSH